MTTKLNLRNIDTDYINASDYGAIGDGITDDTQALINALSASNNKTLILDNNSTYIINDELGSYTFDSVCIEGNNSTLKITGLTQSQLDSEGDSARGWWYLNQMLDITSSISTRINNLTFDVQNTFVYQVLSISGTCFADNLTFKDLRYPNDTFSNQWATSNEAAFVTEYGENSDIKNIKWTNIFHRKFDDTLIVPNASGEFQGRALAINGTDTNNNCNYSNLYTNEVSIGVVIDKGSNLSFNDCVWIKCLSNAVYELGALNVKYRGCAFDNCLDQGITTYGSNILIQGCTFYNVKNRCIAFRNSSKNRINIIGNTFRHQTTADVSAMMPIGIPDGSGTSHDIHDIVISNNVFRIENLDYYIADIGKVSRNVNISGNAIYFNDSIAPTPMMFRFIVDPSDRCIPNISGNTFESDSTKNTVLCSDYPVYIHANSYVLNNIDDTNAGFKFPDSAIMEIQSSGNSSRTLTGSLSTSEPRGQLHIKSNGNVTSTTKSGYGAYITYAAEGNYFSTYSPYTIGATGFVFDNNNNFEVSAEYQFLLSTDPSGTKTLDKVASIDNQGRYVNNIAGSGIVLKSPDGTSWEIKIDNAGVISTTQL